MIQILNKTKMHTVEMVVATRIRYNVDFLFVLITMCLIFKDSIAQILFWAFEKFKETYF